MRSEIGVRRYRPLLGQVLPVASVIVCWSACLPAQDATMPVVRAPISTSEAFLLVTDHHGTPMANVVAVLNGGVSRVSDGAGKIIIRNPPKDSLRVTVRRMGYQLFDGKLGRDAESGAYAVSLLPTAQSLNAVVVNAKPTRSSLELTGFYDRIQEVQRGAFVGEFFTPELVEAREAPRLTDFLRASRFVQMRYVKPSPTEKESIVLAGRGGCAMVVLVDGTVVPGLIGALSGRSRDRGGLDINELVGMSDIAAIEVYPSIANAPVSIATRVMGSACGVVAIWTGGRR